MTHWIWYPGDFEIWLVNRFNNRRTERGAPFPPFWKQDAHHPTVAFYHTYSLSAPETLTLAAEGQYAVSVDGQLQGRPRPTLTLPAGQHTLCVKVYHTPSPPALWAESPHLHTDHTWLVTLEDKIWIDENGEAHGSGIYQPAASWTFTDPDNPPSRFRLPRSPRSPLSMSTLPSGERLVDFGCEVMGYLVLHDVKGRGEIQITYGESREEALDHAHAETLDSLDLNSRSATTLVVGEATDETSDATAKAFRYACIRLPRHATLETVTMLCEQLPAPDLTPGSFACSDSLVNEIYRVSAYTLQLTTREFMVDGLKRDRWTWSGDAVQSYLMNYYLHYDTAVVRRTIRALRGLDPVTSHINTILDYTFYWFTSIRDYYLYTADGAFVREMWPRMLTLMDYVLRRCYRGEVDSARPTPLSTPWAIGQPDDWVFVDWVDYPMHKRGILCFEQLLLAESLETMALCADVAGPLSPLERSNLHLTVTADDGTSLPPYASLAASLRTAIHTLFYRDDIHAYIHAYEPASNGSFTANTQVYKFPNMFALLDGQVTSAAEREAMIHEVMLAPHVPPITTPYMRFYELAALLEAGQHAQVTQEIRAYWGGMLALGATTFWEKYNPEMEGTAHLAMYGRPYGKSLCHAWGASPVYLLGKYYLGVCPLLPGYQQQTEDVHEGALRWSHTPIPAAEKPYAWLCAPALGGLQWIEGDVPTPFGCFHVKANTQQATLTTPPDIGYGLFVFANQHLTVYPSQTVTLVRSPHNDQ